MFDPKIAISGAAGGDAAHGLPEKLAYEVGRQIAMRGGIVITGATSGVPQASARGAKSVKGQVIGFSPATSAREHMNSYRLPVDHHDVIFFTGQDYAGRDIILIDFSDAVIEISGRVGTLHEFTHAFERHKVIGVLLHSGGTIDEIPVILKAAHRGMGHVVMHEDPKILVKHVFAAIEEQNRK